MEIASLIIAVLSLGTAGFAIIYARRSAVAADKSAVAAARAAAAEEKSAALDADRRHAELTPKFEFTARPANPGSDQITATLTLLGPDDLGSIDQLTVSIDDDHPWRATAVSLPGGPTPEQVADQIWGPYRLVPGTGPGANSVGGILGASRTGRDVTISRHLTIGDPIPLALQPTLPPPWSQMTQSQWQRERGHTVRLALECRSGSRAWFIKRNLEVPQPPQQP